MLYCLCIEYYDNEGNCALTTIQPSLGHLWGTFVLGQILRCVLGERSGSDSDLVPEPSALDSRQPLRMFK